MLPQFLDQWRSTTSNRFVLIMLEGHHLQHRCSPPLFCNFKQFDTKTIVAHHPVIKKEVDGLLVKGVIEPLTAGSGFYSNVFVIPKCTGGL